MPRIIQGPVPTLNVTFGEVTIFREEMKRSVEKRERCSPRPPAPPMLITVITGFGLQSDYSSHGCPVSHSVVSSSHVFPVDILVEFILKKREKKNKTKTTRSFENVEGGSPGNKEKLVSLTTVDSAFKTHSEQLSNCVRFLLDVSSEPRSENKTEKNWLFMNVVLPCFSS